MILNIFYLLIGLFLITIGAEKFTAGASSIARNFGIPPIIIGLTIVAIGTSAPEIVVSLIAVLDGNANLAIGNAIGSNITNIALILGVTALIKPISVESSLLKKEYPIMFGVIFIGGLLSLDFKLSPIDFTILITLLIIYLSYLSYSGIRYRKSETLKLEALSCIPDKLSNKKSFFYLFFGLILLPISSKLIVLGASEIALALGFSELVIGLSIVALGTSLPELATSIASIIKKEESLAIGNILGSNIFNLLAVYSIPGLTYTHLNFIVLYRDYYLMTLLSFLAYAMSLNFKNNKGVISRFEGGLLVLIFIGYEVVLFNFN